MMKVQKTKWAAVNYETGEVLQVTEPMTIYKAMKIFKKHQGGDLTGFEIKPSLKDIR